MEYRIREARICVHGRYTCWTERRFIAERRVTILDTRFVKLGFWWATTNSDWRVHEAHAESDMQDDIALRQPLSTRYFEVEK